jgi:hypothetical protein
MDSKPLQFDPIRQEIAAAAARMIAEFGYDYGTAKRKAIQEVLGSHRGTPEVLPSNEEIHNELKLYQELFQADTQPVRLLEIREIAYSLMQELASFEPIVFGSLVSGTANEHSDIYLLVFPDNPKEIEYWLLNRNIPIEAADMNPVDGKPVDGLQFQWKKEWVALGVLDPRRRRGLLKAPADGHVTRTDLQGLSKLIKETSVNGLL